MDGGSKVVSGDDQLHVACTVLLGDAGRRRIECSTNEARTAHIYPALLAFFCCSVPCCSGAVPCKGPVAARPVQPSAQPTAAHTHTPVAAPHRHPSSRHPPHRARLRVPALRPPMVRRLRDVCRHPLPNTRRCTTTPPPKPSKASVADAPTRARQPPAASRQPSSWSRTRRSKIPCRQPCRIRPACLCPPLPTARQHAWWPARLHLPLPLPSPLLPPASQPASQTGKPPPVLEPSPSPQPLAPPSAHLCPGRPAALQPCSPPSPILLLLLLLLLLPPPRALLSEDDGFGRRQAPCHLHSQRVSYRSSVSARATPRKATTTPPM